MRQEASKATVVTSSWPRRRMVASKRVLVGLMATVVVVVALVGSVDKGAFRRDYSPSGLAAAVSLGAQRVSLSTKPGTEATVGSGGAKPLVQAAGWQGNRSGSTANRPSVARRSSGSTFSGYQPWSGPTVRLASVAGIPHGWAASTHFLSSGGLARSYLMVRPPVIAGASLPVDIILHGRTLTPATMERISRLLPVVGRAIAVYPSGYGRSWNAGECCGVAYRSGINDVAFLNTVIHQVLGSQPDAAADRVYLIGYSNGGRMAMRLVCEDPGFFAGLAAVEAVPGAPCPSTVPLPTVLVESTGDPLLTIATDGPKKIMQGYLEPTVGNTVEQWRQIDGCSDASTWVSTGVMTATDWSACTGSGSVVYALYKGGSHRWPLGTATTPSAQSLIANALWDRPRPALGN